MKKKDIFIQDDISSCGARCIQSLVSFYGGYVPLEIVLEDTNTSKSGTSAFDLVNALKKYGFDAYGLKISLDKLQASYLPAIAHTIKSGYEHFLVIYSIDEKSVTTMDPEFGKKIYKYDEFCKIYKNTLIVAKPLNELPQYEKSKSLLKTLIPILKHTKKKIIYVIILSIIILTLNILLSVHLKILDQNYITPFLLTSLFIIVRILVTVMSFLKELCLEHVLKIIDEESLYKFTNHIFKLPQRYLNNKRAGEIVKKIEDMTFIKDLFIRITIFNSLDIINIIFSFIPLIYLSINLTIVYLIILLLYTFIIIFSQKVFYKNEVQNIKTYNEYSGTLVEYLEGLESIKNLNTCDIFTKEIDRSLKLHTATRFKNNAIFNLVSLTKEMIFGIGLLFANMVGYLSINSNFTLLDLMTYSSIFSLLFVSFESIMNTFSYYLKGKAIFRNICEFNDIKEERGEPDYKDLFQNISFSKVSYTYDHLHYILKDFNYVLKNEDKLLLEGPSGIGKSTLVKCLSGRLDNYEGEIFINSAELRNISVNSLRENIVYIGQEEQIFRKSIRDNIMIDKIDSELFESVCQISLLDEVIKKRAEKENSLILEGATNLSGGEKARLVLARALYRHPKILIVDETLSAVSEDMENTILKNLLSIKNMSLIYITHRNKENMFDKIIKFRKDGTYEIK